MWLTLNLLILLLVLSIYGAFLGAERARVFFNSTPLAIFWGVNTLLLTVGLFIYPSLRRRPWAFMLHLGCVLVLVGSLLGSQAGQEWSNRKFGQNKIYKSSMVIYENQTTNWTCNEKDERWSQLPFQVRLDDFSLDHYPGTLTVATASGRPQPISATPGTVIHLGQPPVTIGILETFDNCRLRRDEAGEMVPYDDAGEGINPACAIEITVPGQPPQRRTIFARSAGHSHDGTLLFAYHAAIRDYRSTLTILENNQPVLTKTIEVNQPLHYGGYHFYQHDYDREKGSYTVLNVVCDSGLRLVFAGYTLLCVGVLVHFWFTPLYRRLRIHASNPT